MAITKLPTECFVDVCGVPFKVIEVESPDRFDTSMGRSDTKLALITLNSAMSKQMKESVLVHEWIHAVLDCIGLGELTNNETLVSGLQNELYRAGFRVPLINREAQ